MAKRKQGQPWDAVFDRIKVQRKKRHPGYVCPAPITDAALNELESQLDCRLPESYRAFMKRFGPGEVANRIDLPPLGVRDEGSHTLLARTRSFRDFFLRNRAGSSPRSTAWLGRLVYFGSDFYGDSYAWDPEDVTNSDPHECRVYHLERMRERNAEAVGWTLAELIQWALDPTLEEEGNSTGIQFVPFVLRAKVKPGRADVKLWLAFNNHTVRDLALSIRDSGQTAAFPILADALQEAGCTNADLLGSCRTGDPDIDGKWVLQILLGKK